MSDLPNAVGGLIGLTIVAWALVAVLGGARRAPVRELVILVGLQVALLAAGAAPAAAGVRSSPTIMAMAAWFHILALAGALAGLLLVLDRVFRRL